MNRHTHEQIRKARKRAIARKQRICKEVFHNPWYFAYQTSSKDCLPGESLNEANMRLHNEIPGKYSKGKIHCSCKMCRAYKLTDELKHSDAVKMESAREQMQEASYEL